MARRGDVRPFDQGYDISGLCRLLKISSFKVNEFLSVLLSSINFTSISEGIILANISKIRETLLLVFQLFIVELFGVSLNSNLICKIWAEQLKQQLEKKRL